MKVKHKLTRRPRRGLLYARITMFPRVITKATYCWVRVTTPLGTPLKVRDDMPPERVQTLLEAYDRHWPPLSRTTTSQEHAA